MDNWSEKCNKIKIKISSYRQNFCMGKKNVFYKIIHNTNFLQQFYNIQLRFTNERKSIHYVEMINAGLSLAQSHKNQL